MYCSTCGTAINNGLNYCKNCGARASGAKTEDDGKLSESSFNLLVVAVLGIPIAGLGIIIGLMSVMKKELGFSNELITIFISASFLLLLFSEAVLIWLYIQRTRGIRETDDNSRLKDDAQLPEVLIKGLDPAKTRDLIEPIPSVVEDTTRSLEPIARKSKLP
ncbi:MAG TPA: zinc ribbon domain-containing protein [Pyrinomonadaceae bacterium]